MEVIILSLGNEDYSLAFCFLNRYRGSQVFRVSGALVTVPTICRNEILIKFINCKLLLYLQQVQMINGSCP